MKDENSQYKLIWRLEEGKLSREAFSWFNVNKTEKSVLHDMLPKSTKALFEADLQFVNSIPNENAT
jgi:hypothetical protein